jgi:hypothetical protein
LYLMRNILFKIISLGIDCIQGCILNYGARRNSNPRQSESLMLHERVTSR